MGKPRQPPSAADPVGVALADAGDVVLRYPGWGLTAADLRQLITAREVDPDDAYGFNTELWLDDGCSAFADLARDGLDIALAEQPGIEAVEHIEREVVLVQSSLALADVHAAAIRALLDVNRTPRPSPPTGLSVATLGDLAESLIPALGWPGKLGMTLDDGSTGWHGCWRVTEPRLLQTVRLWNGIGEMSDGTRLDGTVTLWLQVLDSPTDEPSIVDADGRQFAQGVEVAAERVDAVPPDHGSLVRAARQALPWFDGVATRSAIVAGWLRAPHDQPPYPLWEKAETIARWGMCLEAVDFLRYARRAQPQHGPKFDAVAQRYDLDG